MKGPLILGSVGAAFVLVAALVHMLVVRADSPRYKLELSNAYDGGTDFKRLVRDLSLINAIALFGASLQVAALLWQVTSG
jgi:hypothetical protein